MFSRYKKTPATKVDDNAPPPLNAVSKKAAALDPPKPEKRALPSNVRPTKTSVARVEPADKDRKRKERLSDIKVQLHKELLDNLNLAALEAATEQDLKQEITEIVSEVLNEMGIVLNREERQTLNQELYDEVKGLGPLETLLKDETVNDILVNGPQQIFVERDGKLQLTDVTFKDERHLLRIIDKIVSAVGRRVDESNPYVDARLADGSRFNAMVPPIAVDGSLVSIRKFKKEKLAIDDLVKFGAFTEEMALYLEAAVSTRLNVIVSGGTGSGKTTTLNALSSFIDDAERILTIEDTAELQLQQTHVGRMESRPANVEGKGAVSQRDCLKNALRMRPDRIIVGETRGEEVIDMLQAMNTGHDGSMTTIHANSARDGVSRLENMIAMAGIEMPLKAVRVPDFVGREPDRAGVAPSGRLAPDDLDHRNHGHGGRRHLDAGDLPLPARGSHSRQQDYRTFHRHRRALALLGAVQDVGLQPARRNL